MSRSKLFTISFLIFSLSYFLILPSLFLTPIITRGEGREAQVVQAMEKTQEFILPLRNETNVPSKPPLFHWISYLSSKISGELDPGSIRNSSLLCASLLLASFFYFIAKNFTLHIAILSFCILASNTEFLRHAVQARVDMTFACFFCISIFSLDQYFRNKNFFLLIFSIFALTLATLAKGPFALILSLVIISIYLISTRQFFKKKTISPLFVIFFSSLIIAGSWYYLAYKTQGDSFIGTQLLKENYARVINSNNLELGHKKPLYYIFVYLFVSLLPWVFFIPRAVFSFKNPSFIEYLKKEKSILLHLIWLGIFIIAVSISTSKRSVYFLPVIPSASFLLALTFEHSQKIVINSTIIFIEKICLFASYLLIFIFTFTICLLYFCKLFDLTNIFSVIKNQEMRVLLLNDFITAPTIFVLLNFSLIGAFLVKSYKKERFDEFIKVLAGYVLIIFICAQYYFMPIFTKHFSPISFSSTINEKIGENKLYQIGDEYYAAVFYLNKPAPLIKPEMIKSKNVKFAIISKKYLRKLEEKLPNYEIILEDNLSLQKEKSLLFVKFTY